MTRSEQPYAGDERTLLLDWIAFQRATLADKCAGLTPAQLDLQAASPSTLSLSRLLRHLAEMEQTERQALLGEEMVPRYASATDVDLEGPSNDPERGIWDFAIYDVDDDALTEWHNECRLTDQVLGSIGDLGAPLPSYAMLSARGGILHLLSEYARHNGHADMLRQQIDGTVGY
jgi:hypothetical protein